MRHRTLALCVAAALLLCAEVASSTDQKVGTKYRAQRCEQAKLRAAGEYVECILPLLGQNSHSSRGRRGDPISQCDAQFDRSFAQAEAGGACHTAGGPAALRGPLRAQAERTAGVIADESGCQNLQIDGNTAVCTLDTSTSAVDLAAIITQIQGLGHPVNDNTVFWIEAWGATGGPGYGSTGGRGAPGGYAQTTATLAGYQAFFGTTELFYYLGVNGTHSTSPPSGGDGGTATVISANDILNVPAAEVFPVIIAGGGGGGGAGNTSAAACSTQLVHGVHGELGGLGGIAIADSENLQLGAGAPGDPGDNNVPNVSGLGGGGDAMGTGGLPVAGNAKNGDSGAAPLGGLGGDNSGPQIGFSNQIISGSATLGTGGEGGSPGDTAPGGGGGGGWGGGGGGAEATVATQCFSGGGGGGGSYAVSLQGPSKQCSLAPTEAPASPDPGGSFAQITFDLVGSCH